MTREEGKGKGKKRKKGAASEAGKGPSAEEEEKEENMQTGTANETGKNRRRGRPPKQLSVEKGGPKNQEKIIRDKVDRAKKQAFLEMPGIKDLLRPFNEEHKKILADSLKGVAEQGSISPEDLKQLYERSKREFISKYQKLFQKFFKEEGIIEKFEAIWFKIEDEEDTQCKEKMDEFRETLELECQVYQAFCEMSGVNVMFKLFNEEYMKIDAESVKDVAEKEPELTKFIKWVDEYFMSEFISKCQKLFQKFFKEEGIIEKFEAIWSKAKEERDRKCKEKMDEIRQLLEKPENLEGNLKAGPSNIGSNSDGEWRSSTTTLMTGGVTNSIHAYPNFEESKKKLDDLKKRLEEKVQEVQELQEKISKLQVELPKRDEINSKDVVMQDLAAVSPGSNSTKLLESTEAGTKSPSLFPSDSMDADTEFPCLPPLNSMDGGNVFRLPSLDSMNAGTEFPYWTPPLVQWPPLLDQSDEVLTSRGQGHTNIDDSFCRSSDPPTVVPDPIVSAEFTESFDMGDKLIGCSPPRDFNVVRLAAINPRLLDTGTNNVDQEDNIANQENEAAEADNTGMGVAATSGSRYP